MSRSQYTSELIQVKPQAGFFGGVNSNRIPWLLPDSQYQWSVNTINRGGVVQTRFGNYCRLSFPEGKMQGGIIFEANKDEETKGFYAVVAISGFIYYMPINDLQTPQDWEKFKLNGVQFSPEAEVVYFCVADKTASTDKQSNLVVGKTYRVLLMQDGKKTPAYWDGTIDGHLNPEAPQFQTPIGTWMAWSGNRLWVAVNDTLVAGSDIADPFTFLERINSSAKGDLSFDSTVTGMVNGIGTGRNAALYVMTQKSTSVIQSSVYDRENWSKTTDFQTLLFPSIGCVGGNSIVNHAGLLWWYSNGGLVASDSAAAAFLTSQVKYKDMEMARSKRNLYQDLSGVCAASYESYLLMAVPSGDKLNSHIMVLDVSPASELQFDSAPPAWQGVWTGIRPKQFSTVTINGQPRIFAFCTDYQSISGEKTFNHLWEMFYHEQEDIYERKNAGGETEIVYNKIYCEMEGKPQGDTMDKKEFMYAEVDAIELGGTVKFDMLVRGSKGGYNKIHSQVISALENDLNVPNQEVKNIYKQLGYFSPQNRRLISQNLSITNAKDFTSIETQDTTNIDKYFSMLFRWCGKLGIESYRVFMTNSPEKSNGQCSKDEVAYNIVSESGQSVSIKSTVNQPTTTTRLKKELNEEEDNRFTNLIFVAAITPRYTESFYSSIPVTWDDKEPKGLCLDCARETFEPRETKKLIYDGVKLE